VRSATTVTTSFGSSVASLVLTAFELDCRQWRLRAVEKNRAYSKKPAKTLAGCLLSWLRRPATTIICNCGGSPHSCNHRRFCRNRNIRLIYSGVRVSRPVFSPRSLSAWPGIPSLEMKRHQGTKHWQVVRLASAVSRRSEKWFPALARGPLRKFDPDLEWGHKLSTAFRRCGSS
jgi:hypothetical protein